MLSRGQSSAPYLTIERDFEIAYERTAITTMYAMNHCGMHCTNMPFDQDDKMKEHRFQPRDNVWCQRGCWRDSAADTAMQGLYGVASLPKYNYSLEELSQRSYNNWEQRRYQSFDEYPDGNVMPKEIFESVMPEGLPVCFSDMRPTPFVHRDDNDDKLLPCICGDHYGNETNVALEKLWMPIWPGYRNKTGLAGTCQTSFEKAKSGPVPMFEVYCNMGEHWPLNGEENNDFQAGADPLCQEFLEERKTLSEMHTLDEVNCVMCENDIGKRIKEAQQGRWGHGELDAHKPGGWENQDRYNFKAACDKFMSGRTCAIPA